MRPQAPPEEAKRLAELYSYNILDSEAEKDFNDLVDLASAIAGTPISLISLVDVNRQWFKANKGLSIKETTREVSFCAHTLHSKYPFIVHDATRDDRFAENPFVVQAPFIKFYAGFPLITSHGNQLGTLCVLDHEPKTLTRQQIDHLQKLSNQAIKLLELRKKNQQLEELRKADQKAQQKIVTAAVIEAQEREREQISQELHDNVNQVLTTVRLYNEFCLYREFKRELLEKSVHYLGTAVKEIRVLCRQLSTSGIKDLHLADSVLELAQSVTNTGKVALTVDMKAIEDLEISRELHLSTYRILQELLTNVVKHSEASKAQVTFTHTGETLTLQVTDDGKGFDATSMRNGIGITNIRTRAESQNGTFTFHSTPGQGSTFIITFPLQPPPEKQ